MVERKEYLDQLWAWKDEQQIKVVTGIRRCGKSVLLEQYQQKLLAEGVAPEQIISINFENLDYEPLKDYMELYRYLKERLCTDKMTYIFLDEVQEVPAFEKVVCIITRKGEVLPPFDRKEVRTWNLIAENFKSNVPFKVSVNGCCTTKRATPTTKSGDAENGKYRFATLPCMRNGSFIPSISIFKTKKQSRLIKWQEKK